MNPSANHTRDLIVLAADLDIAITAQTLLEHHWKLSIRQIQFDIIRSPRRDPGCLTEAADLLKNFQEGHCHALVIFDRHGSNSPDSREATQRMVETRLHDSGWQNRAKAIVIDPEIEAWIWTSSPITATALGCQTSHELQSLLQEQDLCPPEQTKPPDPKAAMKTICEFNRIRRSSTLFQEIASRATLKHCTDPAFLEFRETLHNWFPLRNIRA